RNWSLAGGMEQDAVTYGGYLDIRNNVVYNWRDRTTDGGVRRLNFVNNYYKAGASSNTSLHVVSIDGNELNTSDCQKMYVSGNVMTQTNGSYILKSTDDAWSAGKAKSSLYNCTLNDVKLTAPFCESYVNTDSAENAYTRVIDNTSGAGANVPALDYIDSRYHNEVTNGTYTYTGSRAGLKGIIDSQKDCGGYPTSSTFKGAANGPTSAANDTDRDGMPDVWETAHGLDPNNAKDGAIVSLSGDDYTNLEMYLNELAGDPVEFNGVPAAEPISAFETIQAEDYTSESGTKIEDESHVAYIENGDYICFANVDFGTGAKSFTANVTGNASQIELYLDSMSGEPAAVIDFAGSGSWSEWTEVSGSISEVTGKHALYLVFKGGDGYLLNIDSFVFGKEYLPLDGRLITDVTFADYGNHAGYALADGAEVGSLLFGDRAFTYASLPDELAGAEQILTACNDKALAETAVQFTAKADISVYVALDSRMPAAPDWLSAYEKTSLASVSSNDVTFELYRLDVSAGDKVTLGGNGYATNVVNYSVLIVPYKEEVETTTTTVTETTTTTTVTETTTTSSAPEETTTSAEGRYLAGDANENGEVNMADAVCIMRSQADPDNFSLTAQGRLNADVIGGDGVTNNDALAIQRYEAGIVTELPIVE
ncbi:MAG: carbohydrate-binding protein, partial [Ruminococcus sp.]|nr:carbohydrate-binding protein [Ruminococcus sp.]